MDCSAVASTSRQKEKTNQNIQVYVRVRPLNSRERGIRSNEVVETLPKEIIVRHSHDSSKMSKKFTFDRAFGQESKQSEVYHSVVAPLIEEVLSGYNCTVFAYGQTGTGKTHTMIGTEVPELKSSWSDESMIGIIPRALSHLLDELRLMELEYTMRISYLELYNEELCDLLSTDDSVKIRIFDDSTKKGSVIIQGLEEIIVHSKDDVYKLLEKGKERRKTATTLMNAQSSRSHTVFSILVHIKESGMDGDEMLKIGKLNLVDLAGSENISKAGNEKGIRARETVNINQSLLTLGRVITALVERTPHIPYRESKLTRLLQESLGGRTKTSIIATISPGHKDLEETLSTLDYAHRAKNIQNKPELNQKLTKKTVLKEYTEEIDRLKRDLMAARDKNGIYLAEETYNDMYYKLDCQNKELNEKMILVKVLKEEMLNKENIFNEVSLNLVEKTEELKKTENVLSETKTALDQTKKVLTTTKRRYKENKLLVNNHVKTEEKLTGQANSLLQVADKVTEEHLKLQDTLERRKNVDEEIKVVCEQFKDKMKLTFNTMNTDLNFLRNDHQSISKVIKDEMENNIKLHNKFSSQSINDIELISKSHQNSFKDIRNCIEKYSEQFTNSKTKNNDILNLIFHDLKIKETEHCNDFQNHLNNISQRITEQNIIQEENNNNIIKSLKLTENSIKNYTETMEHKFTNIIENLRKSVQESLKQIHLYSIEQKKRSEYNQNKMLEIQKLIGELIHYENENDKNEKFLDNITNDIKKSNIVCGIEITKSIKEFNDLKMNVNENINSIEKDTINLKNVYNDKFILTKKEIDDHKINTDKLCTERIQFVDEIMKITEDNNINETNSFENHKIEIIKINEDAIVSDKNNTESLKNTVIDERDRNQDLTTQYTSFINNLDLNIEKYSNDYNENLILCNEYLNNFHERELKTYTPTGETPNRKNFSYPRILAATSPHENIVKRFRIENQWSDAENTILEDTENNITDFSDDFIPINSTPIKKFNKNNCNKSNPERILLSAIEKQLCVSSSSSSSKTLNGDIILDSDNSKNSTILTNYNKENKENLSLK